MVILCYNMEYTTIRISKETRNKLKLLGTKDETYNDIIIWLIINYEFTVEGGCVKNNVDGAET